MKQKTLERLQAAFGSPSSESSLAYRWNITHDLDLVLEKRGSQKRAALWIPAEGVEAADEDEFYPADRGRGSYSSSSYVPSLAEGRAALRVHIRTNDDLENAMARVLKKANGNARMVHRHDNGADSFKVTLPPRYRTVKRKDALEEVTDDEQVPFDLPPDRRRVITTKKDLTVETMVACITRRHLDVQPEFQRQYVWPPAKASRLIESLLLNIPVPVIYTAENPNGRQVVVDGQQRITSVHSFVTGKFPDGREFRLNGLQVLHELNGNSFDDFPEDLQNKLLTCGLGIIVITADSDPEVRYEVFARINMGSEKLTDQELRNAMYRGTYNSMLKKLAATTLVQKIMGLRRPHPRFADCQHLLRFFALLRTTPYRVKGSMKLLLNRELEQHQNLDPEDLEKLRSVLERTLDIAHLVFRDKAFRRFSPGNSGKANGSWSDKLHVGLWDSLGFVLSEYEKRQIVPIADAVREVVLELMSHDARFMASLTSATDKPEHMRYRTEVLQQRIRALVNVPSGEARSFSLAEKQRQFDRDPTCVLCSQRIHDLDDAEVDHAEPWAHGGATVRSNGRLAHRYCNRARRNGLAGQMAETTLA